MRLRLADGDDTRSDIRTIINRETGEALSCNMPLANRATRRYRRAARTAAKEERIQSRIDARQDRLDKRLDKRYGSDDDGDAAPPDDTDAGGGDDGGDDDDDAMNDGDFSLAGIGKLVGKSVKGASDLVKKNDGSSKAVKKDESELEKWFNGKTYGIDNKIVAGVAGLGVTYLLMRGKL